MPRPRSDKRALNARLPADEFADVEAIAKREETEDRTAAVRLLLAYACRFMPKGWRPEQEDQEQQADQDPTTEETTR